MEWINNASDYRVPIKSWCADIEDQAMAQAERKSAQMQARAAAIDRLVDEGLLEIPSAISLAGDEDLLADGDFVDVESQLAALKAEISS